MIMCPPPRDIDGILVTDLSLKLLAVDGGAATIVRRSNELRGQFESVPSLPDEILRSLKSRNAGELPGTHTQFQIGKLNYSCRVSVLQPCDSSSAEPLLALHVQRNSSVSEALREIAIQYELTAREHEALMGISIGLTYKEVAERMKISPNTVKNFLRLIMIKMGVPRRAGIISKVLEYNQKGD